MHGGLERMAELADLAPAADRRGTARRLLGLLKPHTPRLLLALVFVVLGTSSQAIGPIIISRAIEGYLAPGADASGLGRDMLLLLGVYALGLVGFMLQVYLIGAVGQRVLSELRLEIFDKVQRLAMRYFDHHDAGDLMSRLVNDTDIIGNFLTQGAMQSVGALLGLVMIVAVMLYSNLYLALVTLLVIPAMALLTNFFSKRARLRYRSAREAIGEVSSNLQEDISGIREAQAFARTDENIERFSRANAANRDANVSAVAVTSAFTPAAELLSAVALAIVIGFGGFLVTRGQADTGTVVAFVLWVGNFFRPIQQLAAVYTQAQAALAGAERVFDLLDEPQEQSDPPDAVAMPAIEGRVAFENVDFGYDPGRPVLQDINFVIEPGQTLAVVGATGAGKSTLANLLLRHYELDGGRITVDGYDIRHVQQRSLRQQMGVVPQEPFLFSGTVGDNIRYGRPGASTEEVTAAVAAVGAEDFIAGLPEGYDTPLGERGVGLSAGQRQLIALARAALVDPRILILDEATANIDTRTERLIQSGLEHLLAGRSSLVIAHRLSTVRGADQVLVLDDGRIVERGGHAELLAAGGRYAELYRQQLGGLVETVVG
jgi:ATP-binding cassette subfamily B protein/subfamily B ATP-binding cassette protein MsbA